MNPYIEDAIRVIDRAKYGNHDIDVEQIRRGIRLLTLPDDSIEEIPRTFKRYLEMVLSVHQKRAFERQDLEMLFEVIWFFWDYNPYNEDPGRQALLNQFWPIESLFDIKDLYQIEMDNVLMEIKTQEIGLFDQSNLNLPMQQSRMEIRRSIILFHRTFIPPNDQSWYI